MNNRETEYKKFRIYVERVKNNFLYEECWCSTRFTKCVGRDIYHDMKEKKEKLNCIAFFS